MKRSAELPIDDPRSEVRGRGLHLDDDVPIVTPTVQQAEPPADAAEAHMSMCKIELIPNATAKMMNAAVICELTSAEVWTLAKTVIEFFGASVSRFANKFKNYGIDSTLNHRLDSKTRRRTVLGPRNERGQRKIGANTTRTSDRTLDWKRAMHLFSHVTLSLRNEDPN